jgi:hypothetical protein
MIFSSTDRFPLRMTMFMNFARDSELYTGSGATACFSGRFRRGIRYLLGAFSRLAPYLERPCFRFLVPAVSSVPLMMW